MIKNIIRIIIGIALICGGLQLNAMAWDLYDYGLQPYRLLHKGEVSRVPRDEVGDYFGDLMESKETDSVYQSCKRNSIYLSRLAVAVTWAGLLAIAIGALGIVVPPAFRILGWLYIPDFLRRHRNDAAIEMAPEASPAEGDRPTGQNIVPLG